MINNSIIPAIIRKNIIYNYKFLIITLLIIVLTQFIYIIVLKIKKKKFKRNVNKFEDLSSIIIPLNQKINTLKEDKENYIKTLSEVQEEIKLYSEEILNIIETGVLLLDKDNNIIYQNNWFKENNISELSYIMEIKENNTEKEINNHFFLIKNKKYENMSVYTINDITEIKKLEQEIQIKEKLAYLGEMSASIAHEFKNSLTAIKGFASALRRKSDNPIIVKNVSKNIEEEVDYFHKILIDYLNYSKEITLIKENINIKTFFYEITSTVFKGSNITLNTDIENIYADKDKLKQVFINLIKNSIEASDNESLIEIDVTNINKQINILIKDSGAGISEENMKKIYNPFFTTKSTGTGLGTSISYQIIKAHKGTLEYKNRSPKGTITIIKIPVN